MKTRFTFVALLALASATFAADKPLNIVLLYADDVRFDSIGAAGNKLALTPNIDRLAASGVRFTQAAVTTAICGVSRASLYTGQWMSRHGNQGFDAFKTPWSESLTGQLRTHGYEVAHVGKWHCGKFPAENYDFGRSYYGKHWITTDKNRLVHVTKQNETDALDYLRERKTDRPFFLTVAFFAAHAEDAHPLQFLPQPESYELYRDTVFPIPATANDAAYRRLPDFLAQDKNEGRNRWRWRFDTPGKYQEMMRNYFRLISEVDATCGRILAELEKQGLADSTLIVFTSDNGYYHGEHGLADKWYPHQESIRVPLIVRDPRAPAATRGKVNDDFVLNVDLAPTLLAAAGVPAPPRMQGKNFAPLYLAAQKPAWRTEFFYEHPTLKDISFIPSSEALVRKDAKYFLWPDYKREQLFDLVADPIEDNDLIAAPAQQTRLAEMRARFNELKKLAP